MNRFSLFSSRLQGHFDYFLDAVRIYLGVGLLIKGVGFLIHPELLPYANEAWGSLIKFVPYIHIVAGAMLALGIFPRVAALVQIPVLFGAVFLVNFPLMQSIQGREAVEFSALVLMLLAMIALFGAGRLSVMEFFRKDHVRVANSSRAWLDDHADVFVDAIRFYLGVALIVKGAYILDHREQMFLHMNRGQDFPFMLVAAAHYVIPAHFVGGALLIVGMLTRFAAALQLPVLFGALLFFARPGVALLEQRQSVEFTGLVLFLLALITVFGSGRYSLEEAQAHRFSFRPKIVTAGA